MRIGARPSMSYPLFPVLIVDDEPDILELSEMVIRAGGFTNVTTCQDSREVESIIENQQFSLMLLDLNMPHRTGLEILEWCAEEHPLLPIIVVSGVDDVHTAVRCMKIGAFDYLLKPLESEAMIGAVKKALELAELRHEYNSFKQRVLGNILESPSAFEDIITNNATMRSIFQYVETIAPTRRPVLITGETGVGKDLLARAVHRLSGRTGDFVVVNVAGLDDAVFSDTLFGHTKGAYTGAEQARDGLIASAAQGTIFLDEIGDLSGTSQIKLLRLLQDGDYFPIGSDVPKQSDARIVAVTNRDPKSLAKADDFRTDLFYRLQSQHIHIPPLRERVDDLPVLVNHFLEKAAKDLNKKTPTPPKELFSLLATYHFPGNVRELDAMAFSAVTHHTSRILSTERFKAHIEQSRSEGGFVKTGSQAGEAAFSVFEELPTLKDAQGLLITEAMRRADGNQTVAAQILGITQSGLSKALRRVGLSE